MALCCNSRRRNREQKAALVIAATNYKPTDTEHPLPEAELKQKKLESVALAYAASFATLLPDGKKDQLQINITEIGKTWDKLDVIDAFKAAGFKCIQINGKGEWNQALTLAKNILLQPLA